MTTEHVKILANALIGAAIVGAVILGKLSLEQAAVLMCAVLVPSAGPELAARFKDALAASKPPRGPSILPVLILAVAALVSACTPAKDARASAPPCEGRGLTVDECAAEYGASLAACSTFSTTRAESEECEDRLRERYHRPARPGRDGGAS